MAAPDLSPLRAVLIDMDGVLYLAEEPLPGAAELLTFLQARSFPFLLVTNNASRSPAWYQAKLARLGMPCPAERVLTSALAAAGYVADHKPGARVMVVGEEGLREAMEEAGLTVTDRAPDYVVAGIDRRFSYHRGRLASSAIRAGARFVGTNPDRTYPTPEGLVPGAGAVLAFLEAASGQAPVIVGKPERPLFQQALARLEASPRETLMVGDRPDTDIEGARRLGIRTAWVRTGVARDHDAPVEADWVFEGLPELVEAMAGRMR